MKARQLASHISRLDALFAKASELQANDELLAHWARYLCVLVSGLIEKSIITIYVAYAQDRGHDNLGRFVSARLKRFQNANRERITQLVASFSPDWARQLEGSVDESVWAAIDSVVANRNQIAHGENAGISYVVIKDYYSRVKKFLKVIDDQTER